MSAQSDLPEASHSDDEMIFLRRKHRHGGELIAGLNLTAMMDVMTILLVYLIKVYAEAPENITLNDDLRPPSSTAPENIQPSVQVLISKSAILVDRKKILDVSEGRIVSEDPKAAYAPLSQALTARVDVINAIAERGGAAFDGNLMIVADEETPYDLVSNVLYQAGKAQFTSYRLVVRRGQ
jgi:biopolymer transport protein ExbD